MKTLIVLLAIFALSQQTRILFPAPWAPRSHLMPLFYSEQPAYDVENKIGSLLSLTSAIQPPFTVTRTLTLATTLEIGTPYVAYCIPTSMFSIDTHSERLTTECPSARRRRDVELDDIQPSAPSTVETTAITTGSVSEIVPDIESSQEWIESAPRRNFGGFSLTKTIYATSYDTVYSYTPVTDLKTVSMAANLGLACLPHGYTVCP